VGRPLRDGRYRVAPRVAAGPSVLRLSARRPPHALHDQRTRERARAAAQDPQAARTFPNDEAALKLLYLALRNITTTWTLPVREWKAAMQQFAVLYDDGFLRPDM